MISLVLFLNYEFLNYEFFKHIFYRIEKNRIE
jgi:hypothetical protein